MVIVLPVFHQSKRVAKYLPEASRVVPNNRQAAATLWTVESERTDDHMSTGPDSAEDSFRIGLLVVLIGQKIKRGSIMPEVINLNWLPCSDIGDDPFDPGAANAKPRF